MTVSRLFPCRFRRLLLLSFGRDVREMREVVCHVLDHLREEGPQTTMRRLETVKVLHLLGVELSLNRFLSLDFRFKK